MRIFLAFVASLFAASQVSAQSVPDVPAAPPPGIYVGADLANLTRMPFSRADVSEVYSPNFSFSADVTALPIKLKATLPGPSSATKLKGPSPNFYFYLDPTSNTPPIVDGQRFANVLGRPFKSPYDFRLLRFTIKKGDRSVSIGRMSLLGGTKHSKDNVQVRLNSEKLGPNKFRAWPEEPLQPGHYAFVSAISADDLESDMFEESVSEIFYDFTIE